MDSREPNNADLKNVDPDNPPENVLVFRKGDDLSEALHTLLLQDGYQSLTVWLLNKLVTAESMDDWFGDFAELSETSPDLLPRIHAFLALMVNLDTMDADIDRMPIIRKAVHRRLATGLYQNLDQSKQEIRVLKFLRNETQESTKDNSTDDSELSSISEFRLVTRSLDDPDFHFDALSYTWGDTTKLAPILVNNRPFLVTANLFQVLEAFRRNKVVETYLWVDAICINQQDIEEMNHFVNVARLIYSQAEHVRIWVGPESKYSAALFDGLEDCGGEEQRPNASIMNAELLTDVESGRFYGLLHLLSRQWFTRLWIIQEFALAKDPVLHCGKFTFDFERVLEILRTLWTILSEDKYRSSPIRSALAKVRMDRFQQLLTLVEHIKYTSSESSLWTKTNPVNLLDGVQDNVCSVQHDRIYALAGLFPPDLQITPSYETRIEKIFEDATMGILKWSDSLDAFRITALSRERKMDLPSWVPEYGNTILANFMYRAFTHFKADIGATCGVRQERNGELIVRALILDVVEFHSKPLNEYYPNSMTVENFRSTLRKCREIFDLGNKDSKHDSLAFWQTLTTNRLWNAASGAKRWNENDNTDMVKEFDQFLYRDTHNDEATNEKSSQILHDLIWDIHRYGSLFMTRNGRPGFGDAAPIEKGDVLAILAGSTDPAVLRLSPEHGPDTYRFVQNCYYHGVMDGEAVAEAFQQQQRQNQPSAPSSTKMNHEITPEDVWATVTANRRSETRYKFQDEKPESFWVDLRAAIDPLFVEVKLV